MNRFFVALAFLFVGSIGLFAPTPALADPTLSNDPLGVNYGQYTGLSDQDVRVSVARVIRFILGFLGLIFVILIIYAGFMWMTAAGNDDRVGTAKKILGAAIVGVVIILFAFAITQFVIVNLYEVSTSDPYNTPR